MKYRNFIGNTIKLAPVWSYWNILTGFSISSFIPQFLVKKK